MLKMYVDNMSMLCCVCKLAKIKPSFVLRSCLAMANASWILHEPVPATFAFTSEELIQLLNQNNEEYYQATSLP